MHALKQFVTHAVSVLAILCSASVFAQSEAPSEQATLAQRTLVQLEKQFIDPLNQSLSAVAQARGYAIEESYTYVDPVEAYDSLFDPDIKLYKKSAMIFTTLSSTAMAVTGLFVKRLKLTYASWAAMLAYLPQMPLAVLHLEDAITIAPNCGFYPCLAIKSRNYDHHLLELHYQLAPWGFRGSCLLFFKASDFELPTQEGYDLVPSSPLIPYFETMKLNYWIDHCTHKGVFPQLETTSEGRSTVATGSIQLGGRP